MSHVESVVRRILNPWSTRFTLWWCNSWIRGRRLSRQVAARRAARMPESNVIYLPSGEPVTLPKPLSEMSTAELAAIGIRPNMSSRGEGLPLAGG